MLLLGCALLASSSPSAAAQPGAPAFDLKVEHVDGSEGAKVYQIASSGTVVASRAAVWRVLTDYDHLAEFLPNLKSARVVSRSGDKVVVEQLGTARFLFFSQTIRLRVQVQESSPDRIDISLIDGDMKVFRASWELKPVPGAGGTRVVYNATIAPKFDVPGIVGTGVVRKDIGRMMGAVLQRAERQE
ncbi:MULTISPECIES: SRPBCC family protein [unclassified Massilia]|uniref:SRPBCC family protein n=1 Tax=unclassified Massilia TaxID=2609279 RepID=UPI001E501CBA|nr:MULTISPECIES: SRPBCC family protein [unclassified Massilia]